MKHQLSLLVLAVVVGTLVMGGSGEALAQVASDPDSNEFPEWWDIPRACSAQVHWDAPPAGTTYATDATWDCGYDGDCEVPDCSCVVLEEATNVEINFTTRVVTVTLEDCYYEPWDKAAFFYVRGNGPAPDVNTFQVEGKNDSAPDSTVKEKRKGVEVVSGTEWGAYILVHIEPQPDRAVFTFTLPPTAGIVGVWAGDYCARNIPTVSEWGMVVLVLLLLTAVTIVVGRRRRAAVG